MATERQDYTTCYYCTSEVYRPKLHHTDRPALPASCGQCKELIALYAKFQPLGGKKVYAIP